jgi:hypothetical protein
VPSIGGFTLVERDQEIIAQPNDSSKLRIMEHPVADTTYKIGIDATMSTDNSSGVKGNSKFALVVMKGVHPQKSNEFSVVATYVERPKDFDTVFDTSIRILRYYNKYGQCQIAGELNATGGVLLEKIQKQGLTKQIVARKDLNKTGWVDTKKAWFYRVDQILNWQFAAANRYFKKYAERVYFIDILKDAQLPDDANTDVLDAFLACLWAWGSGDILEGKKNDDKPKRTMQMLRYDNGKPIWEEVEI